MEQQKDNKAVQEFLKLLTENTPSKGQDYAALLWQMDAMERQLRQALSELRAVKQELSNMQENPAKQTASRIVQSVEDKIHALQERLSGIKDMIVENARQSLENVKQNGISALDKTVSFLGIGKALNAMQEDLGRTMADMAKFIETIETIGHELRCAGGHLKNAGRAVAGKEQQLVDGGREGYYQAALLAPMRTAHKMLSHMNNATLAAIGGVERLVQAAGRDRAQPEAEGPAQAGGFDKKPAPQKSAAKEKPSIVKDLWEKKAEAAAHAAPAPKKVKSAEAAL